MLKRLKHRVLSFWIIWHLLFQVCEDLLLVDISALQRTLVLGGFEACLWRAQAVFLPLLASGGLSGRVSGLEGWGRLRPVWVLAACSSLRWVV